MNQKDMGELPPWVPKTDKEWQSRMYAKNTAQATDLSSGRRKSDFYDIPNPTKVYLVVEEHPQGIGHVGIVFEDDGGNTIGYHFGSEVFLDAAKLAGKPLNQMNDKELIHYIYEVKLTDMSWSSGSPSLRPGLFDRWRRERQEAIEMLNKEKEENK